MINNSAKTVVVLAIASALAACGSGSVPPSSALIDRSERDTGPVIGLGGDKPQAEEQGTGYIGADASVGSGSSVAIDAGAVDTVGSEDNTVTEVARAVTAVDAIRSTISIIGDNPLDIDQYASYTDSGAIATDGIGGYISGDIVTGGDTVDTSTIGRYSVTYTVSDGPSNEVTAIRIVNVMSVTVPEFSLLDESSVTEEQDVIYTDEMAVNTGVVDGDISSTLGGNDSNGDNATCVDGSFTGQGCSSGGDEKAENGSLSKAGAAGYDFSKLDAGGNSLAASATEWDCVQDNVTGLVWEAKADMAQGAGLHSKGDLYNWYNTDSKANGGAAGHADDDGGICAGYIDGAPATYCNTEAFVARVNASNSGAGLCGATDWRLPSAHELQSIINYGGVNRPIDVAYFPNAAAYNYWSSSPDTINSHYAWVVHFINGDGYYDNRDGSHRVRLVRGRQ